MSNFLTKLSDDFLQKQKEENEKKRIEEEKAKEIAFLKWQEERIKLIPEELSKLEVTLVQLARTGKKKHRIKLNWDWRRDPVVKAIEEYLKENNISYKYDSYPVFELDYDMCITDRILYYQWELIVSW